MLRVFSENGREGPLRGGAEKPELWTLNPWLVIIKQYQRINFGILFWVHLHRDFNKLRYKLDRLKRKLYQTMHTCIIIVSRYIRERERRVKEVLPAAAAGSEEPRSGILKLSLLDIVWERLGDGKLHNPRQGNTVKKKNQTESLSLSLCLCVSLRLAG